MNEEEKKKLDNIKYRNEYSFCTKIDLDFVLNLIEKLQKENEELKMYNNSITSQLEQMTTEKFKEGWIHQSEFKDFIPVQKVKDKIEELKQQNIFTTIDFIKTTPQDIKNTVIQELQELLEGREENESN